MQAADEDRLLERTPRGKSGVWIAVFRCSLSMWKCIYLVSFLPTTSNDYKYLFLRPKFTVRPFSEEHRSLVRRLCLADFSNQMALWVISGVHSENLTS